MCTIAINTDDTWTVTQTRSGLAGHVPSQSGTWMKSWISHAMYNIRYPILLELIIIYKANAQRMCFRKRCLVWVPEEHLGQSWAKLLLKYRKCHFTDPRIQKLPGGRVLAPSRKLALLAPLSPSLGKFIAICLFPLKTNGLASPV